MDPVSYLRVLRRRWPILLGIALLAVVAAYLVTARTADNQTTEFEATTHLLAEGTSGGGPGAGSGSDFSNPNTLAALVALPDVAERVADEIGFEGDARLLTQAVEATPDPETGIIQITATSRRPDRAEELANAFGDEVIGFAMGEHVASLEDDLTDLQAEIKVKNTEINKLDKQIDKAGDDTDQVRKLETQRDAAVTDLGGLQADRRDLEAQKDDEIVSVLQAAEARPLSSGPLGRTAVVGLAGLLGLLAGAALALAVESVDTRIRTKQQAERHFDLPVLAEIPRGKFLRRGDKTVTLLAHPQSPQAEAYRLLRAGLVSRRVGDRQEPENGQARDGGPRMILVTSPGPGEGKSTVAANLAVAYAELGRSVVLVSCDFHRPRLHKLFGIQNDRGLTDAVQSSRSRSLDGYAQLVTDRPHEVRLVPSGARPESPSELLSSEKMQKFLERAREEWDVVILDTAPLLAATDATHLLEDADAVLVVGRAGRTTADEASRTRELLDRLGAATVGVALTAVAEGTLPRRYSWYLASGDGSRKESAKEAEKAGGKASARGRDAERGKDAGEASEKDADDAESEKDGGEEASGAKEGDKGIPRLAGHSEDV